MPYNAVEKTLEAHKPATPAGFAERSDAQVLQLFAEGKKKGSLKRKFTVVLCGLLLALSLTTALAATVPGMNAALYKFWPQAAEALMPINASCVDQGIKMEVESAVVKDKEILIKYSMQDLEGDRTAGKITAMLNNEPLNMESDTLNSVSQIWLGYDAETKKAFLAEKMGYDYISTRPDNHPITFRISYLVPNEFTDLHPLLKEYGSAPETTAAPGNALINRAESNNFNDIRILEPEEVVILDPAKGPDLEINEYVRLTGIGWVDGKLHVQLHYPDLHMQPVGSSGTEKSYPVYAMVFIPTPLDYDISDGRGVVKAATEVLWWSEKPVNDMEYAEYIIECDPAELEQTDFLLQVHRYDRALEGNWEVTVPYRMIKFE